MEQMETILAGRCTSRERPVPDVHQAHPARQPILAYAPPAILQALPDPNPSLPENPQLQLPLRVDLLLLLVGQQREELPLRRLQLLVLQPDAPLRTRTRTATDSHRDGDRDQPQPEQRRDPIPLEGLLPYLCRQIT